MNKKLIFIICIQVFFLSVIITSEENRFYYGADGQHSSSETPSEHEPQNPSGSTSSTEKEDKTAEKEDEKGQAELEAQLAAMEEARIAAEKELNRLEEKKMGEIYTLEQIRHQLKLEKETGGTSENIKKYLDRIEKSEKKVQQAIDEYNQELKKQQENKFVPSVAGDPVSISKGCYFTQYSDISFCYGINKIDIKRKHLSSKDGCNIDTGSFGNSWTSSFDTRIIRCEGIDTTNYITECRADLQKIEDSLLLTNNIEIEVDSATEIAQELLIEKEKLISVINELEEQKKYRLELIQDNHFVAYGNVYLQMREGSTDSLIYVDEEDNCYLMKYDKEKNCYNSTNQQKNFCIKVITVQDEEIFLVEYINGLKKFYGNDGLPISVIDRHGLVLKYLYSENRQLIGIEHNQKRYLKITRDGQNRITEVMNEQEKNKVTYEYERDHLVRFIDSQGDVYSYIYDDEGDLIQICKPDLTSITINYGVSNNLNNQILKQVISVQDENGFYEYFSSDIGKKMTYTDADGKKEEFILDDNQNVISDSFSTQLKKWTYDEINRVSSYEDNFGSIFYYYDETGNLILKQYPDNSTEEMKYGEPFNNLLSFKDRDNIVTNYSYTQSGDCSSIIRDGKEIYYAEYNYWGGVIKESGIKGNFLCDYDSNYKLIKQNNRSFRYDEKNRLSKITNGSTCWDYSYSNDNKQITSKSSLGQKIDVFFNNRKDIEKEIVFDNISKIITVTQNIYDKRHHLSEILIGQGLSYNEAIQNSILYKSYSYTPVGLLKSEIKWNYGSAINNDAAGLKIEYEYSSTNKLQKEESYFVDKRGIEVSRKYKKSYRYSNLNNMELVEQYGDSNNLLMTMEINSYGKVNQITDGINLIEQFNYSNAGRLLNVVNKFGGITSFDYDNSFGFINCVKENEIPIAYYEYQNDGSLAATIGADGFRTDYNCLVEDEFYTIIKKTVLGEEKNIYDNYNRLIQYYLTDYRKQNTTQRNYEYNSEGECIITGNYLEQKNKYDCKGRLVYSSSKNETYEYDIDNRITAIFDSETKHKKKQFFYNAGGFISSIETVGKNRVDYYYNPLNQLIYIKDKIGIIWEGEYDANDRLIKEQGRFLPVKEYVYNDSEYITLIKENGELVSKIEYTNNFSLITITDVLGNKTSKKLDSFGRLIEEVNRLGEKRTIENNPAMNMTKTIDFNGNVITNTYSKNHDSLEVVCNDKKQLEFKFGYDKTITEVKRENSIISFLYNTDNLLSTVNDNGIVINYEYDSYGNTTEIFTNDYLYKFNYIEGGLCNEADMNGFNMNFKYNNEGYEIQSVDTKGNVTNTKYDDFERPIAITTYSNMDNLIDAEFIVYDKNGRIECTSDKNRNICTYTYDEYGRINSSSIPYLKQIEEEAYEEMNECGCISSKVNNKVSTLFSSDAYDKLVLLWSEYNVSDYSEEKIDNFWYEEYEYDQKGNISSKTNKLGTINYCYDAENRLIKIDGITPIIFTYDKNGNLLKRESESKLEEYTYTFDNRVLEYRRKNKIDNEVISLKYNYDGLGRCSTEQINNGVIEKNIYNKITLEKLAKIPFNQSDTQEKNIKNYRFFDIEQNKYLDSANGKFLNTAGSHYLYVNGLLKMQMSGDDVFSFSHTHSGSISGIFNLSDNSNGTILYDLNGNGFSNYKENKTIWNSAKNLVKYNIENLYCGKQYSAVTGLYDFGYRYYSPNLMRFTTKDPALDGNNWYVFCNNDPVNFIDPDGRQLVISVDKGTQQMTASVIIDGRVIESITTEPGGNCCNDSAITTAVKSHDDSVEMDTSRTTPEGNYPQQFPDGTSKITGVVSLNGTDYGVEWLITDAKQKETYPDGTVVECGGYFIHLVKTTNTNGCIGVHTKKLMDTLVRLFLQNEAQDPGSSFIRVYNSKKTSSDCSK